MPLKVAMLAVLLVISGEMLAVEPYTFSCWTNGWRKNKSDQSTDDFAIETSRYGLSLDVDDLTSLGFGRREPLPSYKAALSSDPKLLPWLPAATLQIEIAVDGHLYRAKTCAAGPEVGVKRLSKVRLWESGRFVQHYDFLDLEFYDHNNTRLDCKNRLDLVAWPNRFTLNLHVDSKIDGESVQLRVALHSKLGIWQAEEDLQDASFVSMACPIAASGTERHSKVVLETEDDQLIHANWDEQLGGLVAEVRDLKRAWRTGYRDIRQYDEFKITVEGQDSVEHIPLLVHLNNPANVTGIAPMLCDEEGRPTGIPLQLSKNWHLQSTGAYAKIYAMLPPETATYRLRLAYGFYGSLPSASHGQLSLVGYGGHGRWDQFAIGCWGETICFDTDMSLVDCSITDVRMLMARDGLDGRKWGWTNAGWGGDWLRLVDMRGKRLFQNHLKTAYVSHGPCLTDVRYRGCYGEKQEVVFEVELANARVDDYSRTFQRFRYRFDDRVQASDISLFKLGRTHHYRTPQFAYGNAKGLIRKVLVPKELPSDTPFVNPLNLQGPGPHWIAFTGAFETENANPKPNGYRALIIRDYRATIGGITSRQPAIRSRVHRTNPANLDLEILPPGNVHEFSKGDEIVLDLELITLPRVADDYYGPNDALRKHLQAHPNSWKTTHREAVGNALNVQVKGGKIVRSYPLEIKVLERRVELLIRGGVGAVPVQFQGLESPFKFVFDQLIGGKRVPLDQAVQGNDFWQVDQDASTETYNITFNIPLDNEKSSQWLFEH